MATDELHVFVSSTWLDLQPEREAVEHILNQMRGLAFRGMEYFGSRTETTHDASLKEVEWSEVYVGIFGFRYGSGITEAEYRRARELGLPCLIYLKAETGAGVPAPPRDTEHELIEKLAALKRNLRASHTVTHFTSPDHLAGRVAADLSSHLFRTRPPAITVLQRRHNLQPTAGRFVGRDAELKEVRDMLAESRLVTLTGAGGAGKSRLALEVAHSLLAEDPSPFPDGIWQVELASIPEPSLVPQTVAMSLGLQAPRRSYYDLLAEHSASKTYLLLLDNCEHVVGECRVLVDHLLRASPGLRVLVTSRVLLDAPNEVVWRVPSLAIPQPPPPPSFTPEQLSVIAAAILFMDRARAKQRELYLTTANADAVARICHQLDGLPLAIELAAARVRSLSLEKIAAGLTDCFDVLISRNDRVPRHQTIRATIAWSFDLLDEDEQRLFRRLGVFVGGWTIEAAEAVCADDLLPLKSIANLVASLTDQSLVLADDDGSGSLRYCLLETIRAFALEHLNESDEFETTHRRHAAWALTFAEAAADHLTSEDQALWLNRLAAEHGNLRAALHRALDAADADLALRLVGALWRFWHVRGFLREGSDWLQRTLALPDGDVTGHVRAKARTGAGRLAYAQGDHLRSIVFLEESLAIYHELGDRAGIAQSHNHLGLVARAQRRYADAQTLHEVSLTISLERDDRREIAASLDNLGMVAQARGDYEQAHARFEKCVAIYREIGDRRGIASALCNLGHAAHALNDLAAARAAQIESLTESSKIGALRHVAYALEGLAVLDLAEGRVPDATRLIGAADALRKHIRAPLPPDERERQRETVEALQAALGAAGFDAARAEGERLNRDEAVALALQPEPETQ